MCLLFKNAFDYNEDYFVVFLDATDLLKIFEKEFALLEDVATGPSQSIDVFDGSTVHVGDFALCCTSDVILIENIYVNKWHVSLIFFILLLQPQFKKSKKKKEQLTD
jgi:hypothetical protein